MIRDPDGHVILRAKWLLVNEWAGAVGGSEVLSSEPKIAFVYRVGKDDESMTYLQPPAELSAPTHPSLLS